MDKELDENKNIIRDLLGKHFIMSDIVDFYHSINDCSVSEDVFVNYVMTLTGGYNEKKMC